MGLQQLQGYISQDKKKGQRRETVPPGVWIAASKETHLEEDRGQALHNHLFHRTGNIVGSPVLSLLDTLCCAPHSPLNTSSITSSELPGCVLATRRPAQPVGKVGGDGATPLLSQHPRLCPSPEGYQWGRQPFLSLAALSSWAASLVRARLWPDPAPWGQPGNLEQDMPLTSKFSKQAAALSL